MTPLTRARLEANIDYHQAVAEQYLQREKDRTNGNGEGQAEQGKDQPEASNGAPSDFAVIAEMHSSAARMLRSLLAAQPPSPAIRKALTERSITRGSA
jgi:hypothetical protein